MDIFAGCGGLSQGLHDSGVADTRWAVEIFEPAANAFAKNNKVNIRQILRLFHKNLYKIYLYF